MNLNQILYVLEVAKSSSMREAASNLYISQPALSASIRELEEELEIMIFERSNKGVVLTDEGREFVSQAKKVTSQFSVLEAKYLSGKRKPERFSVSTQHYNFAIASFSKLINTYNPEKYEFFIHETKTNEVLEDLRDNKSEVGIISYSKANEGIIKKLMKDYKLKFTALMKKDTYVYVWNNHELANEKQISINQLKKYPCVSFDQEGDSNFYLNEEAMSNYDFEKQIKTDDRATSLELIASTGGYSIGSGLLSEDDAILKGLVSIKLAEDDPLTIGYIVRKDKTLSKYALSYIEELLKYKEI